MTHYSREIEMPKTRLDGLCNFVQMIINQAEAGNTREALLTAVDLLDTLRGSSNPFSSITASKDNRLLGELERKYAADKAAAIIKAHQDGFERGVAAEKARMAKALELVA